MKEDPSRKEAMDDIERCLSNAEIVGGGEHEYAVLANALGHLRHELRHELRMIRLGVADRLIVDRVRSAIG